MTGNEKTKSAFMTLLGDFKADIGDYSEFGFCYTSCPFRNDDACPAIVSGVKVNSVDVIVDSLEFADGKKKTADNDFDGEPIPPDDMPF